MTKLKYKRVLLKLSGEALLPEGQKQGLGLEMANHIAAQIKEICDLGTQVGIVVGAGNIFRGGMAARNGMERTTADNIGMLATVINSLGLQDAMLHIGIPTRVLTAFTMHQMAEPFSQRVCMRHLNEGNVVIMAGGTGNPYFTTDTAAALRGLEIRADVRLKATKVDGVYDSDPVTNPNAKRFDRLTHHEVLQRKIAVMDLTAISLCMEGNLPIIVFNMFEKGNLKKVVTGNNVGTIVYE